jgi:cytochrome b6-f complex iron-sulfur subunit
VWTPPDPEAVAVSRRQFFNRASVTLMAAGAGAFAAAAFVGFLWPTATGGFGGKVPVGRFADVIAGIRAGSGFFYAPEARSWITEYPADAVAKAELVYAPSLMPGIQAGLIASYQKCPHLGCRVPQCVSSQWFECGCHGSQYNRVGEKKAGPAPRGMDHFPIEISAAGDVTIDTGTVVQGPPIGTNTTGQEAEGPHCVGEAGGH